MPANETDAGDDDHLLHHHGYASSEDDIDITHTIVSSYWLVSGDETPVSFCLLPYCFREDELVAPDVEVYLRGTSDNGMCLYVRALAWKLELSKEMKPTFHLKTDKYWTKLLKPRKSYEETIRSILSVSHFLNYALVNPEDSEKAAWDHVKELFPSWAVEPSRNDLPSHLPVVQHQVSSNGRLATSIALQTLDIGVPKKAVIEDGWQSSRKRIFSSDGEDNEVELDHKDKRSKVEVGDAGPDEDMDDFKEDADVDDFGDISETVCCICDNGGEVTGCDGPCMRSFHVHKDAQGADDVNCSTLGFSKSKLDRMDKFYCPNCEAKEHQCYACGELGSSDETAGAAQEVFACDAAMCGQFYHPTCAAELILRDNDRNEQIALAQTIREGKGFVCPMHKCWKCGKGEVKDETNLQFGICRRCPRVWHRQCFPPSILFDEEIEDKTRGEDQITRAWDGLLQNRILIYCKRHPIISNLGTPARTHVKFPTSYMSLARRKSSGFNKLEQMEGARLSKVELLKKDDDGLKQTVEKKIVKVSEADAKKITAASSGPIFTKKKLGDSMSKGRPPVFVLKKLSSSISPDGKSTESCENDVQSKENHDFDGLRRQEKVSGVGFKLKPASSQQSLQKSKTSLGNSNYVSDETRRMVDSIIEKAKAKVTLDSILKVHEVPINYRGTNPKTTCRKHSLVRIASILRGMQKAVETLENGGSIEDAKMKCSPHLIKYLEICRNDLRVYMSPFLHGARYTSYGRHFTKTEKLEQIADRLQWYMDEGDMIVDFCCGANEFSLLVKEKLDESGKKCSYKNFDAIQTNNDFHFTKKDWFKVKQEDLLDGNKLIMGLNPPFGVKAALANQFIDHALKFKPKLIVLIVPKETERLDHKREKYELIWEDPDLLEGKSFYLPGSVDVDDNPLNDWNAVTPPLYLWSRSDWTSKHKQIALEKGHISTETSKKFLRTPWIPHQHPRAPLSVPEPVFDIYKKNNNSIERGKAEEYFPNGRDTSATVPMAVDAAATFHKAHGNILPKVADTTQTNKHLRPKVSTGITRLITDEAIVRESEIAKPEMERDSSKGEAPEEKDQHCKRVNDAQKVEETGRLRDKKRHWSNPSSVVDLKMYSSKDAKNDQNRDYRKLEELRHEDHRQILPRGRYNNEVHPTNFTDHNARRLDLYKADGQSKVYEDPSHGLAANHATNLRGSYGDNYRLAPGGQFDQIRRETMNSDNYQGVAGGNTLLYGSQVDLYNRYNSGIIRPENHPFMGPVGMGAMPPQSNLIPQYPTPLNYRVFDNRLARAQQQAELSQYPQIQGRLGGWIDD